MAFIGSLGEALAPLLEEAGESTLPHLLNAYSSYYNNEQLYGSQQYMQEQQLLNNLQLQRNTILSQNAASQMQNQHVSQMQTNSINAASAAQTSQQQFNQTMQQNDFAHQLQMQTNSFTNRSTAQTQQNEFATQMQQNQFEHLTGMQNAQFSSRADELASTQQFQKEMQDYQFTQQNDMMQQNFKNSLISGGIGAAANLGGNLLSAGVGYLTTSALMSHQAELQRQNFDYTTGKAVSALTEAGLPSWMAYTSGGAQFPRQTQTISGNNVYTSSLPGNSQSLIWTGSSSQLAFGVGNLPQAQ